MHVVRQSVYRMMQQGLVTLVCSNLCNLPWSIQDPDHFSIHILKEFGLQDLDRHIPIEQIHRQWNYNVICEKGEII